MQNFITNSLFIQKTIAFIKKYGIFITPVLLFLVFMFLLVYSYTRQTQKYHPSTIPTPSQTQTVSNSPSGSEGNPGNSPSSSGEGMIENEKDMALWTNISLSDSDFDGLNATKTTLPDGSTQYSYASDTPNRPNIIVVKNGINIFQRTPMQNTEMDPTESTPDYISHGSLYWGANNITYIYLSKGFAYVGDPSTNQVLEEMIFQPGSIDQFKQYDTDMTGQLQKP